jgi:predicted CXXCH cytochrome family protein
MRRHYPIRAQGWSKWLLGGALLSLVSLASAGIFNTKHNLGATGINAASNFSGTSEICVFCHTPHGADASAAVPLWNRNLSPVASGFSTYDQMGTTTLDAQIEPIGSVSIACLSCHDGTQAMDSLINEPGSGADVWAFSAGRWSGQAASVNGRLGPVTVITNLGKDLTNDHPISVQFAGGGYSISNPFGPGRDTDFNQANSKIVGSTRVWWVNAGTEGGTADFEKTDMKLYTRTATKGAFVGEQQPYVECASCHDPHVDYNPTFLRIDPAGSAVCLTCHNK